MEASPMKILVAIKQAGTLDDEFELSEDERAVDPDFLEFELNDWDRFSIEEALQIRERLQAEVVVVSMGGDEADDALRTALAMGADRAIRVGYVPEGAFDPLAVAQVVAQVAGREAADLLLFGAQASDLAFGATGVACAGMLGLPHVAVVSSVELDAAASSMIVGRELEGGVVERLEVDLPALLTVQSGINEPRYVTLRAVRAAGEADVQELSLADLDLDEQGLASSYGARTIRVFAPDSSTGAEMLTGSPPAVAERIRSIVAEALSR